MVRGGIFLRNMERQFNEQQQTVIRAEGGYHLVLAPPGCGKTAVLAERIVQWRTENGPFVSAEQIMDVEGIGEGKYAEIKDQIYVEGGK